MAKVFLVTPTYNEKENLPILVEKVFAQKIPDLEMIVIDDNSPDGTADIAEALSQKYPIKVIKREKKTGLGTAYVEAFKKILNYSEAGKAVIVQMDADLSHDPSVLPKLLEKISDYDVVLGSRYTRGGEIVNWNFMRRFISKFGNVYAKTILGLPYSDLTGGFKCFGAHVLKNLDLDSLSSTGYNFQIETTHQAHKLGYKICEIPITFTERKIGKSKFNLPIILEAFWKVLKLRFFSIRNNDR